MPSSQWIFHRFRLDPDHACLWRDAEAIALPPKAFAVLHYLVTHPDRLVTKDELLDAVWPETAVSDVVVRIAIGALRKLLEDTAQTPRVIATIPRRGYRFLTPVTVIDPPTPDRDGVSPQHAAPVLLPHGDAPPSPVVPALQGGTEGWRCAVCQQPQSPTARFCGACGAPHVELCRVCGQAVPLPATFCSGCGHRRGVVPAAAPLTYTPMALAEKIRTSRGTVEGERKHITVLFGTITDSLELLRGLDPEAAQQLLDPALHIMMDAVHRYEGTVNQVLGDGIMALFGAPIAHEDHAVRACYAALAMQAALRDYAKEVRRVHALAVYSRVGLHSGDVVVRTIRNDLHMDYSAVGQTTHLASRMEQVASPDTIVLTPATARLVAGVVRLTPLGPAPLHGLGAPMEVWELLGASGRRQRLQIARTRGLTSFVGREAELAALHRALDQAGAGHGQMVAVVGEAGVGKSRLVDEFVQAAHTQGWVVLDSTAVSYGQGTPYFPVLDLLRRYCRLEEHEDVSTIKTKVTERILTLDAALQDTIPAFLALLDALPADSPFMRLDAPQRREHTHTALKRLLVRQSQTHPLLLVCEDLHWLDTATQALLDSLSESLPTARLLLLINYRPEYRHGWGSKTYYTQLRLDPLPPASVDAFLQALVGADPCLALLAPFLIQRTEGNPFFLEESVQTLVETGALVGAPGAYRLAHTLPTMQVPATVQAVLAARIDRLPAEEKRLLQTAAVIGMEVPLALLQAVGALPAEALRLSLMHLQDAEFLYEVRLFPELVYTFKHALTQEVAYGSLLQERRRALHAQSMATLETLTAPYLSAPLDRLAYHALQGEIWDKAVAYCQQAGAQAVIRVAYQEAVRSFEQALEALQHLPDSHDTRLQAIDLRLALREALWPLGEIARLFIYLQDAAALAEALDDQHRLGWASVYLLAHFGQVCDTDRARSAGQRALAIAAARGEVSLTITAQFYLGNMYFNLGDYRQAGECHRHNVAALHGTLRNERFGLPGLASVHFRNFFAASLANCGAFPEARGSAAEAVQIAEAANHLYSRVLSYWAVGFQALRQGDLAQALPRLEQALTLAQGAHIRLLVPRIASTLGAAYTLVGRTIEALELLEQAVAQARAMHYMIEHALRMVWLGEAYLCAGRLDEAYPQALEALEFSRAHQERGNEASALRLLGDIATRCEPSEIAQAEDAYHQALALAEELGMRPLQAHCHRGLGTLYATSGQPEQARTALSAAIAMYTSMDMTFWLPQTEAALAQLPVFCATKRGNERP